jgi:hypothetical protein
MCGICSFHLSLLPTRRRVAYWTLVQYVGEALLCYTELGHEVIHDLTFAYRE